MKVFVFLLLTSWSAVVLGWEQPTYDANHIAWMRSTKCTNMGEVQQALGWTDATQDPYPSLWYNTVISPGLSCYAIFENEGRQQYRLESLTSSQANAKNGTGLVYLTHATPCGVCSDLQNLATYLDTPDLTNPVRACGLKLIKSNALKCLENVGFKDACTWIWYWNTKNTKKTSRNGGCLGTCLLYAGADNIETRKRRFFGSNPCSPNECQNTINGQPVCQPDQYENGQFRLNPCLQCDECRSGPIFQKNAGRTRRGSGIPSAIPRPSDTITELTHYYGRATATLSTAAIAMISLSSAAVVFGASFVYRNRQKRTLDIDTTITVQKPNLCDDQTPEALASENPRFQSA